MKKNRLTPEDPTLKELDAIKRLLILLLVKAGAAQGEIAMALDVDQAAVSRMFPARKVKRFVEEQ
jgi:predicted transcriptional regulator